MANSTDRDKRDDETEIEWWLRVNDMTKPSEREHLDRPEWAYDEDHYCVACGNGDWKFHAPWCELAELYEQAPALYEQTKPNNNSETENNDG